MEINPNINFEAVCRLCLCMKPSPQMRKICEGQFVDILKNIAPISIEESDGLPQQICETCLKEISRCYVFRMMIIKNDTDLRMILHNRAIDYLSDLAVAKEKTDNMDIADVKKENADDGLLKPEYVDVKEGNFKDHLHTVINIKEEIIEEPLDLQPTVDLEKCQTAEKKCSYCPKTFTFQSFLKRHMMVHSDKRPYSCDTCQKTFRHATALKIHQAVHTGLKPYVCKECNDSFATNFYLVRHIQRKHTKERPFLCSECGKTYIMKKDLERHMQAHTGKKKPPRFSCTHCNKQFAESAELRLHLRVHTNERPFQCHVCGKKFKSHSAIAAHNRTHTGEKRFGCQYCEKGFAELQVLKRHLLTHTGARPHCCQTCGKSFTQKSTLRTHMKVHNKGEVVTS